MRWVNKGFSRWYLVVVKSKQDGILKKCLRQRINFLKVISTVPSKLWCLIKPFKMPNQTRFFFAVADLMKLLNNFYYFAAFLLSLTYLCFGNKKSRLLLDCLSWFNSMVSMLTSFIGLTLWENCVSLCVVDNSRLNGAKLCQTKSKTNSHFQFQLKETWC